MSDARPDPDALLAKVQREAEKANRGKLKIFFGMAAGVGKTYEMLSEARAKRAEGIDVLIGLVETHGRSETAALLEGLEVLPPRRVPYKGTELAEFDLDAALARKPALIVVDELAHTNAAGSRHPKRWNDVEELLDAGIDVFTAVNVQHLESLRDVVAGITQIQVWESVPDTVFDRADEVELVDLPPEELLERLRDGKVYLPQQAERAIRNFFRKGNLIALRELALRRTAERVEGEMRDYRADAGIRDVWRAGERILVAIGPGPLARSLIRAGRRLAAALHAEWMVVYVETPRLQRLPPEARDAILADLRLAESLGATTATLSTPDMAQGLLDYARHHNATKIVLGRPGRSGWRRWLLGSVVDTVVRNAGDIDVHLLGAEPAAPLGGASGSMLARSRAYLGLRETQQTARQRWPSYAWSVAVTAVATLLASAIFGTFELPNVVMVYLLGVMIVAVRFGRWPSVLASVLSVAAFDFFFVPPEFTFAVSDAQYLLTFAVMLAVALVISDLATRVRAQARVASYREQRASALYELTRELSSVRSVDDIVAGTVRHIGREFQGQAVVLFPDAEGRIVYPRAQGIEHSLHGADLAVAQWVLDHGAIAGKGTDTLPGADAVYFPVRGASATLGVLALLPVNLRRVFLPEQRQLLETFLAQLGQAIERVRLGQAAHAAHLKSETESLRNSLLAAISHDLRTPLAAIVGSASSLAQDGERLSPAARTELSRTILEEAERMANLTHNILDMARLDAGPIALARDWYPVEEIIGAVLTQLRPRLTDRSVNAHLPPALPLIRVDAVLMERLFVNLIENALKYTPAGTPIDIDADTQLHEIVIRVADRGPGFAAGDEMLVFDKFYRARSERAQSGVGLGLTICKAIVEAHGGWIRASNRTGGGALFEVVLPLEAPPPLIDEPDTSEVRS